MMKKWIIKQQDASQAKALAASAGISEFAAKLLLNRGIVSREQAYEFFNGSELSSPSDITDMDKAARIVSAAIDSGDKITVYGDYDCDGVTAAAILCGYLEAAGAYADWYIPTRDEGYGLNKDAVERIARGGTKLIVTVDNGISAIEEAKLIKEKGISLVITDHHSVPERLPEADAIVNPHRSDDLSSCKELAGCALALKLVMAIEGDERTVFEQFGDLAAIGTVGDLVPLTGENRIIVKRGLENLSRTENYGLRRLLEICGLDDGNISSLKAAFTICPRINAAGRFSKADDAARLLLGDDEAESVKIAESLDLLNTQRKDEEKKIWDEICRAADEDPSLLKKRVLVFSGENWHHGIIGIVASRLLEKFGKPAIVITKTQKDARGSARSVDGFSVFKLLTATSELLTRYGGHEKAGGFSLENENVEKFTQAVQNYAEKNFTEMPLHCLRAEMKITVGDITEKNIESLSFFEPFGEGNPSPLYVFENCAIFSVKPLKDGKYTAFTVNFRGLELRAISFAHSYENFPFSEGERADLLASAYINEYGGKRSVNLKLTDIKPAGFDQKKYFSALAAYEKISLGGKIPRSLAARVIPDKNHLKTVYDVLRSGNSLSSAAIRALKKGINRCMFGIAADIFESVGLIRQSLASDSYEIIKSQKKADIENCEYMTRLHRRITDN